MHKTEYPRSITNRVKAQKYMGDDKYSWAVFVDGKPFVTGISRDQIAYYKQRAYERLTGPQITISNGILRAVNGVWDAIAYDLGAMYDGLEPLTNEAAVEACLDADRPTTFGFPEQDKELKELCKKHGFQKVCEAIAKKTQLV